jgi:hypothetical protein
LSAIAAFRTIAAIASANKTTLAAPTALTGPKRLIFRIALIITILFHFNHTTPAIASSHARVFGKIASFNTTAMTA